MIKCKKKLYNTIENQIIYSCIHHSHIKGIGIYNIFNFKYISQGFIGQICARKAIVIFLHSVKNYSIQKLNVVIVGNSGTGKTCLSMSIGLSIDKYVPFVAVNGAELNFLNFSKIEIIKQSIRKAIAIKFFNESYIIEGQVVDIKINEKQNKKNNFYAKLLLKTDEIQSSYKLDFEMYSIFLKKMIKKGDMIIVDKENKIIEKQEYKNEKKTFTIKSNLSEEIFKKDLNLERREIHEHIITMYELDLLNSFSDYELSDLYIDNIAEISVELREKIDKIVIKWLNDKKIQIIKGVLMLDEANVLNITIFTYFCKNLESFLSPSIILSTRNSDMKVHDADFISSHGIPTDFLDRFLIIQTNSYSYKEIKEILCIRAKQEMLYIGTQACELLIKIATECGIRYSIYIISTINLISYSKSTKIDIIEVKKSFLMFIDSKRFIRYNQKLKKKAPFFNK